MTSFEICKLNLSDHVDIMAVNGTLTDIQLIRRKAAFIFITHENGRYVQQRFQQPQFLQVKTPKRRQLKDERAKQIIVTVSGRKI